MSRTLQVAAAYIEPLVQDLAYMDYLQAVGGNRYRTNFFIYTRRFQLQQARYTLRQVGPCAQKLWEAFRAHLEDICAIMGQTPSWAEGLLLRADGYVCDFYQKD